MKLADNIYILSIIYFFSISFASAQKPDERLLLEKRKTETIQQIEFTRKLLDQTRKSAQVTLNQVNLLSKSISGREKLISDLENEMEYLKNQIRNNENEISELQKSIKSLNAEYEKIILATYRNIEQDNYLEYILGAEDINQGYQRLKQIKYINEYRKRLYNELTEKNNQLLEENHKLAILLKESNDAFQLKEKELGLLNREVNEKQSSISKLQKQEKQLLSDIREKQNMQKRIEEEINKVIEEEIRLSKSSNINATPADRVISGDFIKNMGRLPWPVEKGVITGHFGEHNHPVYKNIKITSKGIDINSDSNAKVRSIFDGEVTKVVAIMGANYTVMIKHGEFFTVYTNLINISVKTGDRVKKNDYIGTLYTDKNQSSKLHFLIYKGNIAQDPEKWLAK